MPVTYSVWSGVARISYALTGTIKPWPFHAISLMAHVLAALLVYALLRRLVQASSPWPAWLGAALFAVHPVQVEAVAWASGLKDVLAGHLTH